MVKKEPKATFSWWDLIKVVLPYIIAALLGGGALYSTQMMGCPGPHVVVPPGPNPPVPPGPVISEVKKLVVVSESSQQSPAMAGLVISLQGGAGQKWLSDKGLELVGVVDPGDTNYQDQPCELVTKWKDKFSGKDQVLLLDKDGKFIESKDLPEGASLEAFQGLCTVHSEPAFSDLPWVDCDWKDWPQFSTGDKSENGKFERKDDAGEDEPILNGAEPQFGQGAVAEPMPNPAEGEPIFEDAIPVIPRDQWPTLIKAIDDAGGGLDLLVTRIYDQKSEGSCVSNATCQGMEIAQARRRGKANVVHLSAISVYQEVAGGPNTGSMVSSNLKQIMTYGALPLKSPENDAIFKHTMENTGFYTRKPQGWQETAKRFRAHEVFDVRSYDGFITALLKGYPVVYGRSGHSICAVRPVYKGNQLYVRYANSWRSDWGENGFGYDSESKIRAGASWAFAVRTVVDHK